jgi:L-threonylcarbamoyladenylate synthase
VYGLGANALDLAAAARIFEAKGRPAINPVIVHVADSAAARELAADWSDTAEELARAFWPGPLTLVLPKRQAVPEIVTAGGPTVGIRVPSHPVALALLRAAGVPIAAPSANRSTELSPTTAEHVLRGMEGRIDMVLDGGPTPGGIESTVLSLAGDRPRLLRPGAVTVAEIEAIVGTIDRGFVSASLESAPDLRSGVSAEEPVGPGSAPLASPGMMARHYAPRVPLEVVPNGAHRVTELLAAGHRVGWLALSEAGTEPHASDRLVRVEMPPDPVAYAARLYAALHTLDAQAVTRIVVDAPPRTDDWLAIRDRLRRASTPLDGRP